MNVVLGNLRSDGTSGNNPVNSIYAQLYVAPASGRIRTGQARVSNFQTTTATFPMRFRIVIFAVKNDGTPGNMIAISDIGSTDKPSTTPEIIAVDFPEIYQNVILEAGKSYYIGFLGEGSGTDSAKILVDPSGATQDLYVYTTSTPVYVTDNFVGPFTYDVGGPTVGRPMQIAVFLEQVFNLTTRKRFMHKLFSGNTYIKTLADNIIINQPKFSWVINSGMGEMSVDLGLTFNDFRENYENVDIVFNYRIKTFVQGTDESQATQIYDGLITSYEPIVDDTGREYVRLHVVSQVTTLENKTMRDGSGNTEIAYASEAPEDIMRDLIDKYGGTIVYDTDSIEETGTTVSYTFSFVSFLDAIKKTLQLAPAYWFWLVDPESTFHFKLADFESVDHQLFVGQHVHKIEAQKSIDELKNVVYFKGGGDPPLYKKYERTASVTEYGYREERMSDERVTLAATAEIISEKFLDERDHPISVVRITVFDNSIENNRGYDIESFRPGDIVQLIDPSVEVTQTLWDVASWDVDFWDFDIRYSLGLPMQIREIQYAFDRATLFLTARTEDITKRIEDIKRNLDVVRSEGIPSVPT